MRVAVVTLYATLGQEAIIHGINETAVTHVITSQDLLSKFDVSMQCVSLSVCLSGTSLCFHLLVSHCQGLSSGCSPGEIAQCLFLLM